MGKLLIFKPRESETPKAQPRKSEKDREDAKDLAALAIALSKCL